MNANFMPYEFEVFVSYRRRGKWPTWLQTVFLPLFEHWLGEELDGPKIFIDYEMETGVSWPHRLGQALSRSRVLVALLSRQYFNSTWCQLEFGQILARETECGLPSAEYPRRLIVPAHIHDGDSLPACAREIQAAQLQPFTNVRLSRGSLTEERLSSEIRDWVPDVAAAVRAAPDYEEAWTELSARKFVQQLVSPVPKQPVPPSLG